MHELFLTTVVESDDVSRALRILQGYCSMQPQRFIRRRLIFEGPKVRAQLKALDSKWIAQQKDKQQWKFLSDQLTRQSYHVTLIYDVDESQFGQSSEQSRLPASFDEIPGTLKWNDLPDASNATEFNSRLTVAFEKEKGLCRLLQSIGQRFKVEIIHEYHQFVHNNTIFRLSRYLEIPQNLRATNGNGQTTPSTQLPPFNSLEPFDAEDKWILTVEVDVSNGSDQQLMKTAKDELLRTKEDFRGCFALKAAERLTLETKVKLQN